MRLANTVVLASAINSSTVEPTARSLREGQAQRMIVENTYAPLDLDAEVFRYLIPRRCQHRHTTSSRA